MAAPRKEILIRIAPQFTINEIISWYENKDHFKIIGTLNKFRQIMKDAKATIDNIESDMELIRCIHLFAGLVFTFPENPSERNYQEAHHCFSVAYKAPNYFKCSHLLPSNAEVIIPFLTDKNKADIISCAIGQTHPARNTDLIFSLVKMERIALRHKSITINEMLISYLYQDERIKSCVDKAIEIEALSSEDESYYRIACNCIKEWRDSKNDPAPSTNFRLKR